MSNVLIPNDFIDNYLADANGEFIKVYLYILRHGKNGIDIEAIADALNMTEKDVKRAIKYWDEKKVLKEKTPDKNIDLAKLNEDDEFRALLLGLQNYLGKAFSNNDAEIIGYMYEDLHMPANLIEHLFEVCKQKGKTSLRYIETVALNWYEKGIDTVEKANEDLTIFSEELSSVKKNFGITGRDLTPKEREYIDRWYKEWHMSKDMVEKACAKTVLSTGKASFAYADSILKNWRDGIFEREEEKELKVKSSSTRNGNKFHNFKERTTDLDKDVLDNFNDLIK